jgi:hypothetical protein
MNLLENRLRSLQPRRPSPKLKRRLFGAVARREAIALSVRWIAPAAACMLLAVTIMTQETVFSRGSSQHEPLMGLICSNLNYNSLLPRSRFQGYNSVAPDSFEWTNPGGFSSNVSPFSPARMN